MSIEDELLLLPVGPTEDVEFKVGYGVDRLVEAGESLVLDDPDSDFDVEFQTPVATLAWLEPVPTETETVAVAVINFVECIVLVDVSVPKGAEVASVDPAVK